MNKIEISLKQANNIIDLVNTGRLKQDYIDKFVFEEFGLKIEDNICICVKTIEGNIKFKTIIPIIDTISHELIPITVFVDHGTPSLAIEPKFKAIIQAMMQSEGYEELKNNISDIIAFCHAFMLYVMTYQRDRKEKHSIPRKYSREHRISTSENKVYLLDDIVKYVHDNYVPQGGTHNIQCECWGVRGHYRTYKSGKKVWINAFKKGKKRNEMEPKDKTYYLSKGVTV